MRQKGQNTMSHFMNEANALLAQTVIRNLKNRGMDGEYFASADEAREGILKELPEGASVTWGGSMSIVEMGLIDALKKGPYVVKDRDTAKTPEEKRAMYAEQTLCDYFFMSSNAISRDGQLVNIDGMGGRVACLITGPSHIYVIASMDKITPDLDSAIKRARNSAAPANNLRLNHPNPCTKFGHCCDCLVPTSICNQIVITRRNSGGAPGRIKVILVGEKLGY